MGPKQEECRKDPKLFKEKQPGKLGRLKTKAHQKIESHRPPSRSPFRRALQVCFRRRQQFLASLRMGVPH